MAERSNWNSKIIDEFHATEGKPGGYWAGKPLLLLTTTGAKSGQRHTTPTMYLPDGERLIVFASKGGAPTNPDWYTNLVAHPEVTVEVGNETYEGIATVLNGDERDRLYAKHAGLYPAFAEYQAKTTRKIPVIALSRREG
ncbi:MAG TPA: nitroreductase family deazaflavin-dependent oxidoreductase [Ktedonobacteraceae bacterium]|nr:nitroreductase family deazaflavin-dependent oxidoreductase [Ktedonobacteraceae bacterium]